MENQADINEAILKISVHLEDNIEPTIKRLIDGLQQYTERNIRDSILEVAKIKEKLDTQLHELTENVDKPVGSKRDPRVNAARAVWRMKNSLSDRLMPAVQRIKEGIKKNTEKKIKENTPILESQGRNLETLIESLAQQIDSKRVQLESAEPGHTTPGGSTGATELLRRIRSTIETEMKKHYEELTERIGEMILQTEPTPQSYENTSTSGTSGGTMDYEEGNLADPTRMILKNVDKTITVNEIRKALTEAITVTPAERLRVEPPRTNKNGATSAIYYIDERDATIMEAKNGLRIGTREYKTRRYIKLPCCQNCQRIRGHTKEECDQPNQKGKICHRCAEIGHVVIQCEAEEPACYNCEKKGHSSYSMTCPWYRKNLMDYRNHNKRHPGGDRNDNRNEK